MGGSSLNSEIKHRIKKIDLLDRDTRNSLTNNVHKLRNLDILRNKLDTKLNTLESTLLEATNEIEVVKKQIADAKEQYAQLSKGSKSIVTEHALLRYLERFHNIDINQISNEIMKLPKNNVVKRSGVIVTVYPIGDETNPEYDE